MTAIWWAGLSLEQRFWLRVKKSRGCWVWTGQTDKDGYGKIRLAKKPGQRRGSDERSHRVSWELHNGVIPPGKWVLHTCDNTSCVNPEHLYLGTIVENGRDVRDRKRLAKARLTSCHLGHEFTESNTYIRPNGTRCCRTCRAARAKARYQRKEQTTC